MFPFVVLIINLRKLKQKISRKRRNENWRKKRLVKRLWPLEAWVWNREFSIKQLLKAGEF